MTREGGSGGVAPGLSAQDLVDAIPEAGGLGELVPMAFRQCPSGDLTLPDIIELSHAIQAVQATGVVVTQGTDTLEETAFALDRLVPLDAPVVVTGAMRNPTIPSSDGPANLLAALRVAASEACRGLGTLVVMNDEVHAARFVRKTHTQSCAAFQSGNGPPLGRIAEGHVNISSRIDRKPLVQGVEGRHCEPVALITMHVDADRPLLQHIAELGYKGVVIAAFGGGHVPSGTVEAISDLAEQMPTVVAPRVSAGSTLKGTYAFAGSESDLRRNGAIFSGDLDAFKARILLALLIAGRHTKDDVREHFRFWGGG